MSSVNIKRRLVVSLCAICAAGLALGMGSAYASPITGSDIVAIPDGVVGSGNGTLDLRMFTFAGGEVDNDVREKGTTIFNGDNANNTLPNSNNAGTDGLGFAESYITTAGKLKAFYDLNFGANVINQIVLFVDLNETGNGEPLNTLALFDVIRNPTTVQGAPNPMASDVVGTHSSTPDQADINHGFTGGTVLASLNPAPAANLPVNNQGAGFADYVIFTGINPYSLSDSDVLLFNLSMSKLDNGAEEIFLSGTFAASDIPEPGSAALFLLGVGALLSGRRRRA